MRTTEWVLIDTETSGLGQPIHCVELAAQRMKGVDFDGPPFRALLNHDIDIEPQAEALHGYSRTFLRANGREPADVHREFNAYAGGRPVVAYNLSFDWARVLEPEVRRLGMIPTYQPGFCALTLARRCVHETDGHKLATLRGHFFPDHAGGSHRALADVEVTLKLIVEIIWPRLARAGIESFSSVADFSRKTPVRDCIDRICNPKPAALAPTIVDPETELIEVIEGMLADDQIVDAEVWTLRHWLDTHIAHQSEVATRSREMITAAFADGALSDWELDEIRARLARLIGSKGNRPSPQTARRIQGDSSTLESPTEKKRRLSLTKRQLEQETGAALLELLGAIVADGVLSPEEVEKLTLWLAQNRSHDLPAIGYLSEVVQKIVGDGKITDSERIDLFLGIEKVLPVTERRTAKDARQEAAAKAAREAAPKIGRAELESMVVSDEIPRSKPRVGWRSDAMTDAQSAFIRSLGGSITEDATKGEASDLIEALLGKKPITNRQQMVMRFWARDRQPGEGPREISEWMDAFYREDGDRKLAWELFKNESEDDGLQGDPSRVPPGVGPQFLARIRAGGEASVPRFKPVPLADRPPGEPRRLKPRGAFDRYTFLAVAVIAVVILVGFMVRRTESSSAAASSSGIALPAEANAKAAPPRANPTASNRGFVAGLKVSGLIGGTRARVMIDGKLMSVGDVVDMPRGILVHSINPEVRTVTFIDTAGEVYSRMLQ